MQDPGIKLGQKIYIQDADGNKINVTYHGAPHQPFRTFVPPSKVSPESITDESLDYYAKMSQEDFDDLVQKAYDGMFSGDYYASNEYRYLYLKTVAVILKQKHAERVKKARLNKFSFNKGISKKGGD